MQQYSKREFMPLRRLMQITPYFFTLTCVFDLISQFITNLFLILSPKLALHCHSCVTVTRLITSRELMKAG